MDYQASIIYKLQCEDGHYYYGSTRNLLHKRFYEHKKKAVLYPERRVYKHILANGGWDATRMVLVEAFPCANRGELIRKEDEFIRGSRQDPMCLNTLCAVTTPEQYKERQKAWKLENKEAVQSQDKEYREGRKPEEALRAKTWVANNQERVKERKKAYKDANREDIHAKDKIYRDAHKPETALRVKTWATNNRDRINERKRRSRALKKIPVDSNVLEQ